MMETPAIIETDRLTKIYNGRPAVEGVSFRVHEGEIFGFLGPNGAGKTTTLLMLLGLTEPTSGTARVLNLDPAREPVKVKGMIGYLPENMGFYRDMNAVETLRFIADLNALDRSEAERRIAQALETVRLAAEAHKPAGAYSRGMRQRLGIAEVLVKAPKIAFLDEPTLGLDPDTARRMIELIQQLCRERKMSVLLSSHHLHHVQKICDRVGIMIDGRMVACGSMEHLAREKLGVGQEAYTLEELYMKYFQED